ncbi:MSMEG_4193 family putative phosphomutase [Millisia brevis]|uniref:MSMEG_4193 family putative phosphomutase n=1 Tax=Millisia brevis TaxID=264148 RepID=UPI0008370AF4|nr:MSMEG_4193 family putative phosphomutase [Millisia brevis]
MTVILLRHGRSTANTGHVLAGRTAGVELDERGRGQARDVVTRLADVRIDAIVRSPLVRCEQTVGPLAAERGLEVGVDERLIEVDYGSWTGRTIGELVKEPLWRVVQDHPSAAIFPEGEGLAAVQARAVAAVREIDARLRERLEREPVWVACSHGDVIKALIADALGTHLDSFQRIVADPASMSVLRYTATRPFVLGMNLQGGELPSALRTPEKPPAGVDIATLPDPPEHPPAPAVEVPEGDAVPGGGR